MSVYTEGRSEIKDVNVPVTSKSYKKKPNLRLSDLRQVISPHWASVY